MPSGPIAAIERALKVMTAFGAGPEAMTLAALAQGTGIHKTTLLRILATLESNGFTRRLPDGRHRLGPELFRLGSLYQESFDLAAHVRPVLAALTRRTGESAAFYIPDGDSRICLCRSESSLSIRHHVREGQSLPMTRGTAGRVLLAFSGEAGPVFDRIRGDKVVTLIGDRVPEVSSVCAPVFGSGDLLAGALQVSGPAARVMAERHRIESEVLQAAQDLTEALGGRASLLIPDTANTINA